MGCWMPIEPFSDVKCPVRSLICRWCTQLLSLHGLLAFFLCSKCSFYIHRSDACLVPNASRACLIWNASHALPLINCITCLSGIECITCLCCIQCITCLSQMECSTCLCCIQCTEACLLSNASHPCRHNECQLLQSSPASDLN